jgi:hypothetical protein
MGFSSANITPAGYFKIIEKWGLGDMKSLIEVRQALDKLLQNEATLRTVAARIILRTGINILEPKPQHIRDSAAINKVCDNLKAMGLDIY